MRKRKKVILKFIDRYQKEKGIFPQNVEEMLKKIARKGPLIARKEFYEIFPNGLNQAIEEAKVK